MTQAIPSSFRFYGYILYPKVLITHPKFRGVVTIDNERAFERLFQAEARVLNLREELSFIRSRQGYRKWDFKGYWMWCENNEQG
jgi:hypothetical protein